MEEPEAPDPATCEFAEPHFTTKRIFKLRNKGEVMIWMIDPDRCSCKKAKDYWAKEDARKEGTDRPGAPRSGRKDAGQGK